MEAVDVAQIYRYDSRRFLWSKRQPIVKVTDFVGFEMTPSNLVLVTLRNLCRLVDGVWDRIQPRCLEHPIG